MRLREIKKENLGFISLGEVLVIKGDPSLESEKKIVIPSSIER